MHVQGNCTHAPPSLAELGLSGAPLQWTAPQCVLITQPFFLRLRGPLWMDSLYLRASSVDDVQSSAYPLLWLKPSANLYATRLALQGDGSRLITALYMYDGAKVYMEGVWHPVGLQLLRKSGPVTPPRGRLHECSLQVPGSPQHYYVSLPSWHMCMHCMFTTKVINLNCPKTPAAAPHTRAPQVQLQITAEPIPMHTVLSHQGTDSCAAGPRRQSMPCSHSLNSPHLSITTVHQNQLQPRCRSRDRTLRNAPLRHIEAKPAAGWACPLLRSLLAPVHEFDIFASTCACMARASRCQACANHAWNLSCQ